MQPNQPQPTPPPQLPVPPVAPDSAPQPQENQNFYNPIAPQPTYAASPESHQMIPQAPTPQPTNGSITWEASEYVHNDKGGLWIIGFLAIVVVFVGIAVWLNAWTFAALIVVMAIAMAVFAFRPPRVIHYLLNDAGVQIGDRMYFYSDFRAFGVLQDGAFFTLTFIPVKRFSPALSIYFAQDQGENIVDVVGEHLPMENIQPDFVDTLMRRLRF